MRLHRLILPITLLLCATFLRLYHLDFRALWWDEGLSLFFARLDYQTNARMAVTLADTNPPIYRMLLGYWAGFLGWSAFSARLFSALPGIILVAIIYRLARELKFPKATAPVAMALCAASPMLVYYAQEAKGYSLVAMAGTGSVLAWWSLHSKWMSGVNGFETDERMSARHPIMRWVSVDTLPDSVLWFVWGLMLLLSIGSHYITAFLVALENLWTLALTIRNWRGNESKWIRYWAWQIGAQVVVALILLPFILLTFGGTSAAVRGETGEFSGLNGPLQFFGQHALELTQGPGAGGGWGRMAAIAVIGLLVIGYWRLGGRSRLTIRVWWLLISWVAVPILLGFALNSYHEFFFPRFVLYVVPAIMLLIANGISYIAHRLSFVVSRLTFQVLLTALIAVLWTPTLLAHYTHPGDPVEDWRPLAEAMRPLAREGDAAVYVWGWMPGYLDAYLPPTVPRPHYHLGFFTPESLDPEMTSIISRRSRVWLLDYEIDQFDGRNAAGRWLGERSALVYEGWFGKGHIALFGLRPTPITSPKLLSHEFANGLKLTLPEMRAALRPGDALVMSLVWETTQPISDRMTIFFHGQAEDGTLAFSRDSEPNNGLSFVTDWTTGQKYSELRGLLIPPDTLSGRYVLTIGIYNTLTGAVDERGPVTIGAVVVR